MEIFKEFIFDAAHHLPNVTAGHKCGRLHGHSFRVTVHASGPVGEETGWVMDFAEIKAVCDPILAQLDHHCLNDIEGLANPTCENIARWIWQRLRPRLPQLTKLVVHETRTSGCVYQGQ